MPGYNIMKKIKESFLEMIDFLKTWGDIFRQLMRCSLEQILLDKMNLALTVVFMTLMSGLPLLPALTAGALFGAVAILFNIGRHLVSSYYLAYQDKYQTDPQSTENMEESFQNALTIYDESLVNLDKVAEYISLDPVSVKPLHDFAAELKNVSVKEIFTMDSKSNRCFFSNIKKLALKTHPDKNGCILKGKTEEEVRAGSAALTETYCSLNGLKEIVTRQNSK